LDGRALAEAVDDAVGTGGDGFDGFAVGGAVAEEFPVGILGADFGGAEAFVGAVVPFDEVGVDFGDIAIAGDDAGFVGALEGAGVDLIELDFGEAGGEAGGFGLAVGGEGDIGEAGVLGGEGPGGFAVAG
jgi:hypothetical protein